MSPGEIFNQDATLGFVADDDRHRLMVAMADLAYERDYTEIGEDQIEARAGLPPGTFAAHFASKQECIVHAYDASLQQTFMATAAAYARVSGDWTRASVAALDAFLTFVSNVPTLTHLSVIVGPQVSDAARAFNENAPLYFADFLRPGYAEAEQRYGAMPPLETITQIISGGLLDLIRRYCVERRVPEIREAHGAISVLLGSVLVGPEAALEALRAYEAERDA